MVWGVPGSSPNRSLNSNQVTFFAAARPATPAPMTRILKARPTKWWSWASPRSLAIKGGIKEKNAWVTCNFPPFFAKIKTFPLEGSDSFFNCSWCSHHLQLRLLLDQVHTVEPFAVNYQGLADGSPRQVSRQQLCWELIFDSSRKEFMMRNETQIQFVQTFGRWVTDV